MDARLEEENGLVLDVVQATLGLISPHMRAISVGFGPGRIVLYFAVEDGGDDVEEGVNDIVFELDALRGGSTAIEAVIYVGDPAASWPGREARAVYLAKP